MATDTLRQRQKQKGAAARTICGKQDNGAPLNRDGCSQFGPSTASSPPFPREARNPDWISIFKCWQQVHI